MKAAKITTTQLFSKGILSCEASVIGVTPFTEVTIVFLDESPFHPSDYLNWDQPGDHGTIKIGEKTYYIDDSQTFFANQESGDIVYPKSKGDARSRVADGELVQLTGHILIDDGSQQISELLTDKIIGKKCVVEVNKARQENLSKVHTAVHLMSLALNHELHDCWTKQNVSRDSFEKFDFDSMAIDSSKIEETFSLDTYRIGKSIRKKGLSIDCLQTKLQGGLSDAVTNRVNSIINSNSKAQVLTVGDSDKLGAFRMWKCTINNVSCEIPCGGTHVTQLQDIGEVAISIEPKDDGTGFIVKTSLT